MWNASMKFIDDDPAAIATNFDDGTDVDEMSEKKKKPTKKNYRMRQSGKTQCENETGE